MNYLTRLLLLISIILSQNALFAQENLNTASRVLTNLNYSVIDMVGDNYLGSPASTDYQIDHSLLSIYGDIILGLNVRNPIAINLYPNPFSANFQLDFKVISDYEIIITTSSGLEIKRIKAFSNTNIELIGLPKGVYIVRVTDLKKGTLNVYEIVKI